MASASAHKSKYIDVEIKEGQSHQNQIKEKGSKEIDYIEQSNTLLLIIEVIFLRLLLSHVWWLFNLNMIIFLFRALWNSPYWHWFPIGLIVGKQWVSFLKGLKFFFPKLIEFDDEEKEEEGKSKDAIDSDIIEECEHKDIDIGSSFPHAVFIGEFEHVVLSIKSISE